MYELNLLFSPLLEKINEETMVKTRDMISGLEGNIKKENIGEKRKLSYPVKKQIFGFYVVLEFEMEPDKTEELRKQLNLNRDILRFLLIDKTDIKEEPARVRPIKSKMAIPTIHPTEETRGEKVKIEELDKKLEEILKE